MFKIDVSATRKKVQDIFSDYLDIRSYLMKQTNNEYYEKYPGINYESEVSVTYGVNYDAKLLAYLEKVELNKKNYKEKIKFQKEVIDTLNHMEYEKAQFLYIFYILKKSQNKTTDILNIGRNKFYQLRIDSERSFALLMGIEVYETTK